MTIHSTSRNAQRTASIAQIVTATAEVLGQEITATAAEMIATDLAEYQDQQIADGLKACRRELTGRLTLAAVIERIQRTDGHPEPNEAWAIALQANDESRTVVMTEQMQKALHAAQPILDNGDAIGARMAFIDAYRRWIDEARQQRLQPQWAVSLGWDPAGREEAINRAMEAGYISIEQGEKLLLQHQPVEQGSIGYAVAGLITGRSSGVRLSNAESRQKLAELRASMQKLAELRAMIKQNEEKRNAEEKHAREAKAADLNDRRAEALKALSELPERVRRTV